MKYTQILCLAIAAAVVSSPVRGATPQKKFFRDSKTKPRPRQAGGTVVVNAASYLPGVSPGGLATVYGTNLTDVNGVVVGNSNPLPLTLANVAVNVNGVPAAMFSVAYANGQDVISFQVPWETPTGSLAAEVQVFDYGNLVADEQVDSFTEDPGIFEYQRFGNTYAVAAHTDGSLISPDDPASPGEIIVLYTTGLGPVDQYVPDGFGAPYNPPANTLDPFAVAIDGENARVLFSGLAPGFVGLYQLNLILPGDLPAGDLTVQINSPYANSQTVLLSVQ